MQTLLIANQKGGVGKSILSYNLAHYFADQGKRVLFVDSDPQANSSSSLKPYLSDLAASTLFSDQAQTFTAGPDLITVAKADEALKTIERTPDEASMELVRRLGARLSEASKVFDVCVIDTPGSNAVCVGAYLFNATHVLVPTEIENYAINVATTMLRRIIGVQKQHNKGLVNLGLLPSRFRTGAVNQRKDLEGLLREYSQYVLRACICDRVVYKEAASESVPVWKYNKRQRRDDLGKPMFADGKPIMDRVDNTQASKEMLAAFELINKLMGNK